MKDHEIRETINKLRDIAIEWHAYEQLRERIGHVILDMVDNFRKDCPHIYVSYFTGSKDGHCIRCGQYFLGQSLDISQYEKVDNCYKKSKKKKEVHASIAPKTGDEAQIEPKEVV